MGTIFKFLQSWKDRLQVPLAEWRAMIREYTAVRQGKRAYAQLCHQGNFYLLRRNVHRLEKGLIQRLSRPVFGLDYLPETLDCYEHLLKQAGGDPSNHPDLVWACDVLHCYFLQAGRHPKAAPYKNRFSAMHSVSSAAPVNVPFPIGLRGPSPVSYENFLQLARRRHSVRWFLPKPVPRELIDQAIDAARTAPSACNRQPFEFRVYDDPAWVKKIAAVPMGTTGFSDHFPAVIVLTGQLRAFFSERDRHLIYIDGSLAAMAFMLALETLGLASCPINWPDIESRDRAMAHLIPLAADEKIVMLIALGYADPDGKAAYSRKKEIPELRSFNKVNSAHAH